IRCHRLSAFSTRLPPSSPLFPYTTLFRSCDEVELDREPRAAVHDEPGQKARLREKVVGLLDVAVNEDVLPGHEHVVHDEHGVVRSEEHTSELQSRENLVCRLLLEKKNNDM